MRYKKSELNGEHINLPRVIYLRLNPEQCFLLDYPPNLTHHSIYVTTETLPVKMWLDKLLSSRDCLSFTFKLHAPLYMYAYFYICLKIMNLAKFPSSFSCD